VPGPTRLAHRGSQPGVVPRVALDWFRPCGLRAVGPVGAVVTRRRAPCGELPRATGCSVIPVRARVAPPARLRLDELGRFALLIVWPGTYRSPRHRKKLNSCNKGFNVFWRAMGQADTACHVIGCRWTKEMRVQKGVDDG
jgi:hypothetical protein